MAQNVVSPTRTPYTPRPTPSTRTAPTLPPEFTATLTPTPTNTETSTPTPTVTNTPDAETICAAVNWSGDEVHDQEFVYGRSYLFVVDVAWANAAADFSWRNIETGEGNHVLIPGGTEALMDMTRTLKAGTHELTLKVITNEYPSICEDSVQVTILPDPDATPEITITVETTASSAAASSPTPTLQPTAARSSDNLIQQLLIEILTLIRDRLREGE